MSAAGLITILFTDIVGSTALAQRIGDDAADDVRRDHFATLRLAVEKTGGTEVKNIGDALMVSYTSAADAIQGAVEMQQGVDEDNRTGTGPRLEMRVGLSAGDATFEDGDWFGAPVVEAARLVDAASPGQILAGDVVRILAGSRSPHELRPVEDIEAKGLPHPIPASEVLWTARAVSTTGEHLEIPLPATAAQSETFSFVGREAEFDQLVNAWKEALTGERRTVLVAGEPGIGKTRLVKELCAVAHEQGALVLWGGSEDELGIPFQPFAEAIRGIIPHLTPDQLTGLLGPLGGELTRLVPTLPQLLPGLLEQVAGDPESERYRLFESVAHLLGELSDRQPLVLVLDDLHWAAKPTLLLLRHLLRGSENRPWLIVITYRDTDLDRTHPLSEVLADLRRQQGVTRLALRGLDEDGVASFMERLAGHDLDESGHELAQALHTETEGNPFFVGEVLLHLAESGTLVFRDGRWTSDVELGDVGIPEGVREVVGRRLSHLDETTNEVLTAAAVIGREFELPVLAALIDGGTDAALDALDAAESSGLIADGTGGVGYYRFAHALVRTTLIEELATSRRLRWHRDIARVLAARGDTEGRAAELAYHFAEAAALGEVENAVSWGRRAAAQAIDELAWEEAIAHLDRAGEAMLLADEVDPGSRFDLLLELGRAMRAANDDRADRVLAEAMTLADQLGDAARLADAVVIAMSDRLTREVSFEPERLATVDRALDALQDADDARRAQLLSARAGELVWTDDPEGRRAAADEALELARRSGDRHALSIVLSQRSYTFESIDIASGYEEYLEDYAEVIALAEELSNPEVLCRSLMARAPVLTMYGDRAAGDADLRRAETLVTTLHQPVLDMRTLTLRCGSTLLSGQLASAEVLLGALAEHAERHNIANTPIPSLGFRLAYERGELADLEELFVLLTDANPAAPAYRTGLAAIYSTTDRPEECLEQLRALHADNWAIVPHDALWIVTVAGTARMAGLVGALDIAADAYALARPYSGIFPFTGTAYEQPVGLSCGTAAAALGRWDEADALFREAIELSEQANAPSYVAGTQAQQAQSALDHAPAPDLEEVQSLASAALETAERLGFARTATLATRVLARL